MRTALIVPGYPPETSPGAKRAVGLADALHVAGHTATVLTQLPYYPDPTPFKELLDNAPRLQVGEDEHGFSTWRFRPRILREGSLMSRLASEARFALRVSGPGTGLKDLDAVVASSPFIFNLAAARSYRLPTWLDVRDLTWEYTRQLANSTLKAFGARQLKRVALSCLRKARGVSATTEGQRAYLIEQGVPAERVIVVPNGVPRATVARLDELRDQTRDRAGAGSAPADGPVRVVYAGLLGFVQGVSFLAEAVGGMDPKRVELHLYGRGAEHADLAARTARGELPGVHVHGQVGFDDYLRAIHDADVLCASLRPEADVAMPSKVWEYMATGHPILFAGRGEAAAALERSGAGHSVAYGDVDGLRKALRRLVQDPELRQELGEKGRAWVRAHQIREDIYARWVATMAEVLSA